MSAEEARAGPELVGDEAGLFREFNSRLVNILRGKTSASRETIDDACAFAWQQFLLEQPDREPASIRAKQRHDLVRLPSAFTRRLVALISLCKHQTAASARP